MNRSTLFIGASALVVLLSASACVGGQMLNNKAAVGASSLPVVGVPSGAQSGANAQGMQTFDMEIESAKEIPQTEPDVAGLLARRGDKSIFITTGTVTMAVRTNPDGTVSINGSADGPEVEVVIPHTAQILVDTTALTVLDSPQPDGTRKQTVEPGSVDEINENGMISVWGERRGDRIIADTVLYMADATGQILNSR
ncbi:MAG: hypothetical protein KIT77_26045 [Caldilinea sp.]|nr:hypothetical protein [Caldilinea sp.]MCB0133523.1 hypothetical protein [Caldilineaceae bacterium]MCB0038434.1 hypothetical protein [Caldilinea sp.]MCB0049950.1 hypothetical protein [Caldilinea sp.]MCB9115982.1 hypothetical protein [Caldilineaceae bacterium]